MDERIVRAMRMIESGMAGGVDFSLVADTSDLSTSHFHQIFLEETGFTPGAYLRRIRLDAAALRLRWTTESVGKIALGLGYARIRTY